MKALITQHIEQSIATKKAILDSNTCMQSIIAAAELCKKTFSTGHKILIAGNGGSAADAQHIAAELTGRFEKERAGLPAIALTTDTSALTAIANDYGYNRVFSRQLEALGNTGDLFIGISTSGNSANIVEAVNTAKTKGLVTICLVGEAGKLPDMCDISIRVPCKRTAIIQESHIMIGHILCALIEAE